MEAFLVSTGIVALAEIGDKTQLLAFILAAKFRKPMPIILGILVATLANHGFAGALGAWITSLMTPHTLRWVLGVSFIAMAVWTLIPDKFEEEDAKLARFGVFGTTFIAFFLAEMGDKTQVATVALAAQYNAFFVVVALESKKEFHPNMVAKLKINDYQSSAPLIVIPIKFIQKTTNDSFVMIAENGKVVNKKISIGNQYNGNAEILSGLNAGDLLITQGYDLVYEGDKIIIKK